MSFLLFTLLTLSHLESSQSAVQLTPSSSLTVCPGEKIAIKCTPSPNVTALRWMIIIEERKIELLLTSARREFSQSDVTTGIRFDAEWRSSTYSTLMTNATLALHDAQVTCLDMESSTGSLTIYMQGTVIAPYICSYIVVVVRCCVCMCM